MLSRRHSSHASEDHGIDLAPMLDFVMNLLIFFISRLRSCAKLASR